MSVNIITIDTIQDFYALKEYIQDNNYIEILKDSPSFNKIKNKDFLEYLEFSFDTHERFIITLANKEKQQEACDWLKNFIPVEENNDDLIYGKDKTERIVSCEAIDTGIELFIETPEEVISKIVPNEYWLLSFQRHDLSWQKLQGELYYRYIKKYPNKDEWLEDRRMLKKKTWSVWDDKESAMILRGFTYFKGMKISDVSILSFDIEATTLEHNNDSQVLLISNTYRKNDKIEKKLFCYNEYKSQGEMLESWCKWVREKNPSIICGHNIFDYDLPYLQHIADLENVNLKLGRDGSSIKFNDYPSQFRKDGSQSYSYHKCYIYGREIIDTMFLAYKYDFSRKYDSYGLKPIIAHEVEETQHKLEKCDNVTNLHKNLIEHQNQRTFYDSSKIKNNYTNPEEWDKIKKYCSDDSDDSLFLFDLMASSYFYLNQSVPKSFQEIICSASGAWINSFLVRSYLQQGHSIPRDSNPEDYEGAISFGNPGSYFNVFKIDVASLYPSIILQYEVHDQFKDPNKHFLKMVSHFTQERLKNKKLAKETNDSYYKDLSEAQKIVINSSYGMLACAGLHFNSPINAAFITRKGREVLQKSIEWAKENNCFVVNADTDSISITYNNGEELNNEDRKNILDCVNSLMPEKIRFEDDGYYPNVLIIKAKNYALFDGKKLKIKGSALKATMKEMRLKEFIKEVIDYLMSKRQDKLVELYYSYAKEILNITDMTKWALKKTVTEKVLDAKRTNEQKVKDALEEEDGVSAGNKYYMYFTTDGNLKLSSKFDPKNPDYDVDKLLEKLFKTIQVFSSVIDIKLFPNFKLKKNRPLLKEILKK